LASPEASLARVANRPNPNLASPNLARANLESQAAMANQESAERAPRTDPTPRGIILPAARTAMTPLGIIPTRRMMKNGTSKIRFVNAIFVVPTRHTLQVRCSMKSIWTLKMTAMMLVSSENVVFMVGGGIDVGIPADLVGPVDRTRSIVPRDVAMGYPLLLSDLTRHVDHVYHPSRTYMLPGDLTLLLIHEKGYNVPFYTFPTQTGSFRAAHTSKDLYSSTICNVMCVCVFIFERMLLQVHLPYPTSLLRNRYDISFCT